MNNENSYTNEGIDKEIIRIIERAWDIYLLGLLFTGVFWILAGLMVSGVTYGYRIMSWADWEKAILLSLSFWGPYLVIVVLTHFFSYRVVHQLEEKKITIPQKEQ